VPHGSEHGEGGVDGRTLELTPESEHVAEGRKMGGLSPDVDLEPVVGVGYTVDSHDRGLYIELSWESGEVRCGF